MAILAVVNIATNELVSTIMAELTDHCPDGCYFVELPPDHIWVNGKIVSRAEQFGIRPLQEF